MATTWYADGQWNFYCDLCGKKEKSSKAQETWDGFRVCQHHKEVRNPQDFLRGVTDNQSLPWSRSKPKDNFVVSTFRLLQENGGALLQEADALGDTFLILRT